MVTVLEALAKSGIRGRQLRIKMWWYIMMFFVNIFLFVRYSSEA